MITRLVVLAMVAEGKHSNAIARVLGVSRQRVSQILKEEGITILRGTPTGECQLCGGATKSRFCSCQCAATYRHGKAWGKCPVCGVHLHRVGQTYCSRAHAARAQWAQAKSEGRVKLGT